MKKSFIILQILLVFSVISIFVTDYIGGYRVRPLAIGPFPVFALPATLALWFAGFILYKAIRDLIKGSHQTKAMIHVAIVISIAIIIFNIPKPGYVHGLRDRFKNELGYEKMRSFAQEVVNLKVEEVRGPKKYGPLSSEEQKIWDELSDKYPFLHWNNDTAWIYIFNNAVYVKWGGALFGHWGFQVALNGEVQINGYTGRYLKVEDDILFYWGG